MKASDIPKLPKVTDSLTTLRTNALVDGVEILSVQVSIGGKPVQYIWDTTTSAWTVSVQ